MSQNQSLVSILMNCFNGSTYLVEAIDTVIGQTYQNWELIFWDNQSTDESANICNSYQDPRIRYFRSERHTNLGSARALALQHASGELIAVLDTDDLWMPRKLELQVPVFECADVGIVISDTVFFNGKDKEKQLYRKKAPPQGNVFYELITRYFVSLETVVLRKAAIDGLDYSFDSNLSHISDFDLIVRVGQNWKLSFVPEILAKWRVHSNSGSWKEPEKFNLERLHFVKKMDLLHPSMDSEWQRARRIFVRNIDVSSAIASLTKGDKANCRNYLSRYVLEDFKSCFLYSVSFLPLAKDFLKIYNKWRSVDIG